MITSACLGEALKTTPYRSMSYLGAAMCIISTAQHASPNVNGHNELFRPQLTKSSTLAKAHSTLFFFISTWNGEYLPSILVSPPITVSSLIGLSVWFCCSDIFDVVTDRRVIMWKAGLERLARHSNRERWGSKLMAILSRFSTPNSTFVKHRKNLFRWWNEISKIWLQQKLPPFCCTKSVVQSYKFSTAYIIMDPKISLKCIATF